MDETSTSRQADPAGITPTQWQAVTELFDRCAQLSDDDREGILAAADQRVAAEVRSLLLNRGAEDDPSLSPVNELLDPPDNLPRQIGPYRIERLLGQGGMGAVFLARRTGDFEQQVAVKLIRPDFGISTRALDQRFRQERQILASLQHPNIAHLVDGGTNEGQSYLVVEYVPGIRLDQFSSQHRLSIRQRIELMLKVCAAVQYAHQNLIVHRDLKPANILVLEDGTPKLLDFGIAKLLQAGDSPSDLTHTAARIFTPSYASPEQLRGEPANTVSDVYSLGVMLYELLAAQRPYAAGSDSDLAMLRAINRDSPTLPSIAIKRLAAGQREAEAAERATTFAAWGKALRGDLDLILSRAIEADSARRYQSVEQFALDLTRYLQNQPVSARKDSLVYQTRKFCSRHKASVSAGGFAALVLLVAGLVLWREYRIAVRERVRAERRFDDLRGLARFDINEVQEALDHVEGGTEVRALILNRALQYIDSLAAEKDNDIDLRRDLAHAYMALGQRLGNPGSNNLGDTAGAIAAYQRSERVAKSIVALPQASEKDRAALIYVRYHMALLHGTQGHIREASQAIAQAAQESDAVLAAHPKDQLLAYHFVNIMHRALSSVLADGHGPTLADPKEALRHVDIAIAAQQEALKLRPDKWIDVEMLLGSRAVKAVALAANGRDAEALALGRENMDFLRTSKVKPPSTTNTTILFATYTHARQLAAFSPSDAVPLADTVLATVDRAVAADPTDQAIVIWHAAAAATLGDVYRRAGQRDKGMRLTKAGIAELENLLAKKPPAPGDIYYPLAEGHHALAEDALQQGNLRGALAEYDAVERVFAEEAAVIPDDLDVYRLRGENQMSAAAVEKRLGFKGADGRFRLAREYADRVLAVHPDNPLAARLRLAAEAALR